jgi:biopolymer transport protein TolR
MHDPTTDGDIEETEKINVVPLADLTLVLLIILMVLSPMISQSMIRVATPQVESSSGGGGAVDEVPAEESVPLLISVSESGVKLNNVRFDSLVDLLATLADAVRQEKNRPVIVSPDDGVLVGRVVDVLDGARQAGAKEVSLVKATEGSR